jgi:hypothetical protein
VHPAVVILKLVRAPEVLAALVAVDLSASAAHLAFSSAARLAPALSLFAAPSLLHGPTSGPKVMVGESDCQVPGLADTADSPGASAERAAVLGIPRNGRPHGVSR